MRKLERLKEEVEGLQIGENADLEYVSGYINAKIDVLELIEKALNTKDSDESCTENKYIVKNKHQEKLLIKIQDTIEVYVRDRYYHNIEHTYELTEKEIKDYDESYWVFAVPVK